MTIPKYNWWGFGKNEPPPHLKTKKQLAELKLAPKQAVAFIDTPKYTLYLYDPNNPDSVKPKRQATEKQLASLKKASQKRQLKARYREWSRYEGFIEQHRAEAVQWVQKFLSDDNWVILDTETTGLGDAEIVEIAVINSKKETLLNTLVRPSIPVPDSAIAIHGITNEMVADAPRFPEIYPKLTETLEGQRILIYNDDADRGFLNYCCRIYELPKLKFKDRTFCLMHWYAQWYGEYSTYWRDFKFQPLNGGHRANEDCLAAFDLLMEIAGDNSEVEIPEEFKDI